MTLYQAYEILKQHSKWRQGDTSEMIKPERLTIALNVILTYLDNKLTKESHANI